MDYLGRTLLTDWIEKHLYPWILVMTKPAVEVVWFIELKSQISLDDIGSNLLALMEWNGHLGVWHPPRHVWEERLGVQHSSWELAGLGK